MLKTNDNSLHLHFPNNLRVIAVPLQFVLTLWFKKFCAVRGTLQIQQLIHVPAVFIYLVLGGKTPRDEN